MFLCSQDQPQNVPKKTLSNSIADAAIAIVNAIKSPTSTVSDSTISAQGTQMSPGKCADLRLKNLEQLRYIQQLCDDNILSDSEFLEQKTCIFDSLRKL